MITWQLREDEVKLLHQRDPVPEFELKVQRSRDSNTSPVTEAMALFSSKAAVTS